MDLKIKIPEATTAGYRSSNRYGSANSPASSIDYSATPSTASSTTHFFPDFKEDDLVSIDQNEYDLNLYNSLELKLWERIIHGLESRGKKIESKLFEDSQLVRKRDKFTFLLSVSCFIATIVIFFAYNNPILCQFPQLYKWFYTSLLAFLLVWRYISYHYYRQHYFLLDYCYWVNFLLLFGLWYYPSNRELFLLSFANANGAVLWAIPLWKNSLVFHDLDKMTSVFIHILPVLVTYHLKWHNHIIENCNLFELYVPCLVFYLFWQCTYYMKVEVIDKKKMENNPSLITSFRYLTSNSRHWAYTWIHFLGKQNAVFSFMALQLLYQVIAMIPLYWMLHYQVIHLGIIIFVWLVCTWNGAQFYIEKFAKLYLKQLEKAAALLEAKKKE